MEDYDGARKRTAEELQKVTDRLELLSVQLSEMRKHTAKELTEKIREGLKDLNFIDVEFSMEFSRLGHYTANGFDEAEFLISTNPGESLKPLGMVASGGELSRIMLAIKTVLADTDDIPTLIFDEIDTGISGRTARDCQGGGRGPYSHFHTPFKRGRGGRGAGKAIGWRRDNRGGESQCKGDEAAGKRRQTSGRMRT